MTFVSGIILMVPLETFQSVPLPKLTWTLLEFIPWIQSNIFSSNFPRDTFRNLLEGSFRNLTEILVETFHGLLAKINPRISSEISHKYFFFSWIHLQVLVMFPRTLSENLPRIATDFAPLIPLVNSPQMLFRKSFTISCKLQEYAKKRYLQ